MGYWKGRAKALEEQLDRLEKRLVRAEEPQDPVDELVWESIRPMDYRAGIPMVGDVLNAVASLTWSGLLTREEVAERVGLHREES